MLFAGSSTVLLVFALGLAVGWRAVDWPRVTYASIGIILALGLQVGLLLGLLTPSIRALNLVAPIVAGLALLPAVRAWTRTEATPAFRSLDWGGAWLSGASALGLVSVAFAEPVKDWDARSIWYFQAKVIYYGDRILDSRLWTHPSQAWSHVDYPKLNAFWAASWMTHFGGWNEYLPKFSLVLLLLPAIFLVVGFARSSIVRLLLFAVLFLRPGAILLDGYMDGILSVYAGLAALYGGRYVIHGARSDLMALLATTALCCGLKNEGAVVALPLVGFALAARALLIRRRDGVVRLSALCPTGALALGLGAFLPAVIWWGWKTAVGLTNDLISAPRPLERLLARLGDGHSVRAVWSALVLPNAMFPLQLVVLVLVGTVLRRRRDMSRRCLSLVPIWGAAIVYLGVLMLVYLTTPNDLTWHLATSADRTMLSIQAILLMGAIEILVSAGTEGPDIPPPESSR